MSIREITVAELDSANLAAGAAEQVFRMDEQTFRAFYEKTARPLWSYLRRLLNNATLADDLLQESYYRFLRADLKSLEEAYQRNYLFRIATNLARDHWRRLPRRESMQATADEGAAIDDHVVEQAEQRSDLGRAFSRLRPQEREILWLAYVEGSSHREIAEVVGLKAASIRLLLFRARRKLLRLLGGAPAGSSKSGPHR